MYTCPLYRLASILRQPRRVGRSQPSGCVLPVAQPALPASSSRAPWLGGMQVNALHPIGPLLKALLRMHRQQLNDRPCTGAGACQAGRSPAWRARCVAHGSGRRCRPPAAQAKGAHLDVEPERLQITQAPSAPLGCLPPGWQQGRACPQAAPWLPALRASRCPATVCGWRPPAVAPAAIPCPRRPASSGPGTGPAWSRGSGPPGCLQACTDPCNDAHRRAPPLPALPRPVRALGPARQAAPGFRAIFASSPEAQRPSLRQPSSAKPRPLLFMTEVDAQQPAGPDLGFGAPSPPPGCGVLPAGPGAGRPRAAPGRVGARAHHALS